MEAADVRILLEWAGGKLLSLRLASPSPQGYRSFWPDYADDSTAYGYTKETMRAPAVAPHEVRAMELILELPALYIHDITTRRIVHRRSLIAPLTGRYIHSYGAIAVEFHINARLAARIYLKGVGEIGRRITTQKADAIRRALTP